MKKVYGNLLCALLVLMAGALVGCDLQEDIAPEFEIENAEVVDYDDLLDEMNDNGQGDPDSVPPPPGSVG